MTKTSLFNYIVQGFFQGIGVELAFLMLWVGWRFLHSKVAHRFNPEHFFHALHDYFMK